MKPKSTLPSAFSLYPPRSVSLARAPPQIQLRFWPPSSSSSSCIGRWTFRVVYMHETATLVALRSVSLESVYRSNGGRVKRQEERDPTREADRSLFVNGRSSSTLAQRTLERKGPVSYEHPRQSSAQLLHLFVAAMRTLHRKVHRLSVQRPASHFRTSGSFHVGPLVTR